MERLTRKFEENGEKMICIDVCGEKCVEGNEWCPKCKPFTDVMKKLAEYEDLEEQGLLLKLPHGIDKPCYVVERCQCGTHYNCRSNTKASARRKAIIIGEKKTVGGYNRCMKIFERPFKVSYLNKIGVSVFLTRTEAEEALRRMEGEK